MPTDRCIATKQDCGKVYCPPIAKCISKYNSITLYKIGSIIRVCRRISAI